MTDIATTLLIFDRWLFLHGNQTLANPLFDAVMPVITSNAFMLPLYALAMVYAMWHSGLRGLLLVGLMVSAVAIADQSIIYIKDYIARERPCRALPALGVQVRLLVECGTGKSFPSAHAANNVAAAVLAGFMFPRLRAGVFVLAGLVAFSRVYCGVHYPFDVVAGAVYGLAIATAVKKTGLMLPALKKVLPPRQSQHYHKIADDKNTTLHQ